MKWLGYKLTKVSAIRFDIPEIKRRTKMAHVAELAADIREAGDEPIHAPTVRAGTNQLICGRDRLAAILILKSKRLWIRIAECDDREARALERRENIYRRPPTDRQREIAELSELKFRELTADQAGTLSPLSDQTIKAKARKEVAKAAGISPASVKKAEQRAAAAKVPPSDGAGAAGNDPAGHDHGSGESRSPAPPVAEPSINLLGVDEPHARYAAEQAAADQAAIDKAASLLQQAQAVLAKATACTPHQEIKAEINRVAGRVRARRPAAICPWCKACPPEVLGAPCAPCGGLGYVPMEIANRAPTELIDHDAPLVAIDGKFYPWADVRDGKAPPKNGHAKKAKKSISVQDEQGNEIPLDMDEAY